MIMTPKEKAKKETFVTLLEKLPKFDDRSELIKLRYSLEADDYGYLEKVIVFFEGGGVKHVNVTGDSCYSILLDVARAVYA